MKKKVFFISLSSLLVACLGFTPAIAAHSIDTESQWDILLNSFDPLIGDRAWESEETSPVVFSEDENDLDDYGPLTEVSYNALTGEVTVKPYEASRRSDIQETPPSLGVETTPTSSIRDKSRPFVPQRLCCIYKKFFCC